MKQRVSRLGALDAIWNRVSKRPMFLSRQWLRRLRLQRLVSVDILPASRPKKIASPRRVNQCRDCLDNCCIGRKSTVLLHLRDIAVLVDEGRADLMTLNKPRFTEKERERSPALAEHVSSMAWSIFPVLRQNKDHACSALDTEGQCTLYPSWPLSCARFPVALNLDADELFLSQRCKSTKVIETESEAKNLEEMECHAVGAYNERVKDYLILTHAQSELRQLGLTHYLNLASWSMR